MWFKLTKARITPLFSQASILPERLLIYLINTTFLHNQRSLGINFLFTKVHGEKHNLILIIMVII